MLSVVRDVALIFRWHGARELAVGVFAIDVAASLGVVALLAVALAQTRGEPRQRFLWISVVPISLALRQYRFVTGFGVFVTSTPAWLSDALVVTAAIVPLAVAYAIVRYRVFDIRVALNRALVLGTIAVLVGCALLVLDWFLSREGVGSSVQLAINIATATIVGFSLNTLQRRLGDRIDAVLFHERYLTRRRYEELERALYSVESRVGLQSLLVAHAPAAFDASSAAFFEQLDDGGYLRTAASNWPPGAAWHILSDHPLALAAATRAQPLRIERVEWFDGAGVASASRPAVAVPIRDGGRAEHLMLLGPHRDGTDLDGSELALLRRLSDRVSAVYGALPRETSSANDLDSAVGKLSPGRFA
jgi:hypothetical protein